MVPFLQSKRLILSPVSEDLISNDSYISWINNQNSDLFTQHAVFPNSYEKVKNYFNSKIILNNCVWLAIWDIKSKSHVGNIDISSIDWINRKGTYNILIGDVKFQGLGIGYEASHLIIRHTFERLGLNRIELGVDIRNLNAIKLYERIGFKNEGISRKAICANFQYFDVIKMGLLFDEYIFDKNIL
jgi:RimJ/RimL family protein N-acetyltransferase